jgi:hypothetical protein
MTKTILALGFMAAISMPLAVKADVLQGVLNATGTATISSGGVLFLDNIFFVNSPGAAQQGDFVALAGTTGTIQNITETPGLTNVTNFITFGAAPNISISLTDLFAGFDGTAGCTLAPAAGQICTPTGSALNFQNTSASSSSATFNIAGIEYDSLTGNSIAVNGLFTLPISGENFQTLLGSIATGGSEVSSFSAQIFTASPTPEPSTIGFLAVGLIGLVVAKSKFSAAKNQSAARG